MWEPKLSLIVTIAQKFQLIVEINHKRSSCHNFCMRIMHGAVAIHAYTIDTFRATRQYNNLGRTHIAIDRLNDASDNISSILFCSRKTINWVTKSCHQSGNGNRQSTMSTICQHIKVFKSYFSILSAWIGSVESRSTALLSIRKWHNFFRARWDA